MKILHCCLAAFYIDGYSYQENILPKIHKIQGHEVQIMASRESYIDNKKLGFIKPGTYYNEHDILVSRLDYSRFFPLKLAAKLRYYKGVTKHIEAFKPDVIFLHDTQFGSINEIIQYCKRNPRVKLYADSHTDFINSAKTWVSKNILHKIIYRYFTSKAIPFLTKYYGTLPVRNKFIKEVYKVPEEKIELLSLGVDDTEYDINERQLIRKRFCEDNDIDKESLIIITGGKIDERKNIHHLLESFSNIELKKTVLVVFGEPVDSLKYVVNPYREHPNIKFIGWLNSKEITHALLSADLAVFPGTHSVLWEQCVGMGIPCIFKKWDGIQHVDLGDNCLFIENGSVEELSTALKKLTLDSTLLTKLKLNSEQKGPLEFAYTKIAKRAIGL